MTNNYAKAYIDFFVSHMKGRDDNETTRTARRKSAVPTSNMEGAAKLALEQMLTDCLTVLGNFEWPGSEVFIYTFCYAVVYFFFWVQ